MRLRTLGLAALLSSTLCRPGGAVVPPKDAEAPIVAAGMGPRNHRETTWAKPARLSSVGLAGWTAVWDRDTDVPLRLWGPNTVVAGSSSDPAIAEAAARRFLTTHLALLAPGAAATDFELVSNQRGGTGGVRSVGFVQRARGLRVLGGTIGFAFAHDRLALVSSTALPNVEVDIPARRLAPAAIEHAARGWLVAEGHAVVARVGAHAAPSELVIVPIVRPRRGSTTDISYRVAEQLAVEAIAGPGRWEVWVDAGTAAPIVRMTTISYASGKVLFDAPVRGPHAARTPRPALATHQVNGVVTTTEPDGTVTWAGTAPASVGLALAGPRVAIKNKAGAVFAETLPLAVDGTLIWSHPTDELVDAQLDAFTYANEAKAFARTRIDPDLAYLDGVLSVTVNEPQNCNAYSTGDDIHFFRNGQGCENTARLADVVYHEFGHSLHANAIIEGVGQFDGSLSEGLADALAAAITGDHAMGRGFFLNNDPLRDLDPVGTEKRWPEDATGEVHDEGEIIGGTLWDLRTGLEAKLGPQAGFDRWLAIYYGIMQRAADIPSTYPEALLADDDDGDLANGTPNRCVIDEAFARHGLLDPALSLGIAAPVRTGNQVAVTITPAAGPACTSRSVTGVVVDWNQRGADVAGQVALTATDTTYAGELPKQPDGTVVQYKVTVALSDGTTVSYPNNKADPLYELYVGRVTPLWCADFEAGATDWVTGGTPLLANEWQAAAPAGLAGDPKAAFAGSNAFGVDLTTAGSYRAKSTSFAETPEIDLAGHTEVRLQYRRWLGVEDGFYDQAKILANGAEIWKNLASATEPQRSINHVDQEWRFQDIDLPPLAASGTLKLRFELASDAGLELGGWTIDDMCVVTPTAPDDTGCCSAGGAPGGALALSIVTLGVALRRRRRVAFLNAHAAT